VRRSLLILLVCLLFIAPLSLPVASYAYVSPSIPVTIGGETTELAGLDGTGLRQPLLAQAAAPGNRGSLCSPTGLCRPITKCKPATAPQVCLSTPPPKSGCTLPARRCGQWEAAVQVLFARVKGTTRWVGPWTGLPASDIDYNDDLGVSAHQVFLEYSARYQFRPTWGVFYSAMPIHLEGSKILERTLYFGPYTLPIGASTHTTWDFFYQKVGILYQPILTCNASVSLFGGWVFNDQKVKIDSPTVCGGGCSAVSRTRNMVTTGMDMQKCLKTNCNGSTLSCDNKVWLSFLDDTFIVDVEAGVRYSVPMGPGRWGYGKVGYRYLSFQESRNDVRMDTVLEGGFAEAGIIF